MKKTIGNYELTECQAIAFEVSDTTKQQAIFIHNINDEFCDGDGVLFCNNIEYIDTEEDLQRIFIEEPFSFTTDWEVLESVEITRYDIIKNEATTFEKSEIKEGFTLCSDNNDPTVIDTYFTKNEALEALKEYKSDVYCTAGVYDRSYMVTEYYVQENVYNYRDEWLSGGDVFGFSKMEGDF